MMIKLEDNLAPQFHIIRRCEALIPSLNERERNDDCCRLRETGGAFLDGLLPGIDHKTSWMTLEQTGLAHPRQT